MLSDLYKISEEKATLVKWQGDDLYYDLQLYELGGSHAEFYVLNPVDDISTQWETDLKYYIEEIPDTRKCIVISHEGNWIAKIFKAGWYPYHGYETVEIVKTKITWTKNSDIDKLMTFEDNPYGVDYLSGHPELEHKLAAVREYRARYGID